MYRRCPYKANYASFEYKTREPSEMLHPPCNFLPLNGIFVVKSSETMKKLLLFSLLIPALCLTACDIVNTDCDAIWDFAPMEITFSVADAAGNDLLDPDSELNILDRITVRYNGEDYSIARDEATNTRAYHPHWQGLYVRHPEGDGCHLLSFGEFSPDFGDHRNDKLTIDWGDGTKDEITFDFYVTWKKCDPRVHRKFLVNGKKQTPFFFEKIL